MCKEFYFLYVSWMHDKICFIISFQIIRKIWLVSGIELLTLVPTSEKKVFNSSAMRFEFDISIPFTINVLRVLQIVCFCSLLVVEVPTKAWKVLATDILEINGRNYLILSDYFSNFPIVRELSGPVTAVAITDVIEDMCGMVGRPDPIG